MADVASSILQWSTTASSNSPSGGTSLGSGLDDNLREIQAVIRNYLNSYNGTPVASSGTTDIGSAPGLIVEISGTTTITGLGSPTTGSMWKIVRFQGVLTLTHNASSLILPGGANIVTAAGDYCLAFYRGSGNWTVPFYQKADGTAVIFIAGLTAETSVALDDLVAIFDTSAGANRKMTVGNLLAPLIPTGTVWTYAGASAPSGWLLLQGGTIGNGSSGGTARANADTEALFTLLYNSMADTEAPVSGGRGSDAAADFAANKTITLPDLRGRSILGTGQSNTAEGGGTGTARTHGAKGGGETHTLIIAEMPAHVHSGKAATSSQSNAQAAGPDTFNSAGNTGSTGGGGAHNNMHPWLALNYIIKY